MAVSATGTTVVVGSAGFTSGFEDSVGAAYVFHESSTVWKQKTALTAADGVEGDYLGWSVAVSAHGSTVVAGAIGRSSSMGAAYVFDKSQRATV